MAFESRAQVKTQPADAEVEEQEIQDGAEELKLPVWYNLINNEPKKRGERLHTLIRFTRAVAQVWADPL